jgi:hypothetical protein
MKRLTTITVLVLVVGFAVVALARPRVVKPPADQSSIMPDRTVESVIAQKKIEAARKAIKATDEYIALTNALRKYDADYTQATNKIASVSDNNTRQALNKVMDAVDDLKTVAQKLRRVDLMIGSGDVNAPN